MALRSFRARLIIGSFLGALGLLAVSHVVSVLVLRRHPVALRLGNGTVLLIVALLLVLGGLLQVWRSLAPFEQLRARLSGVRDGRSRLLEGTYPTEVQPLVNDLNALLEHREEVVRRALAKAGDLAHGLKTPLAVLAREADLAERAGQDELAATIHQQVERMRRQIEYHLAHARAAGAGAAVGARCAVRDSAEALARTLLRLHADRGLTIDVHVAREHAFRGERADLDEMLGNLLDNACKWAKSRVAVSSEQTDGRLTISVDDDGVGLAASMRKAVLQRGVRADEAAPGFGLGLAIVRDLADLYGGSVALEGSPLGGLRANLDLPGC